MSRALLVLLCFATSLLGGCRVLGLEGSNCEPGTTDTCPIGEVCTESGVCEKGAGEGEGEEGDEGEGEGEGEEGEGEEGEGEGEGEEGEGEGEGAESVVDDAENVTLLQLADDDTLWFATGVADGCIRRLREGGSVEDVSCETGFTISGLFVIGDAVYWLADGPGAADAVRTIAQDADPLVDVPTSLIQGKAVAPLSRGPNNLHAVANTDGTRTLLFSRDEVDDTVVLATRALLSTAGAVIDVATYINIIGVFPSEAGPAMMRKDLDIAYYGATVSGDSVVVFHVCSEGSDGDDQNFVSGGSVGPADEDPDPFLAGHVHSLIGGDDDITFAYAASRDSFGTGNIIRFFTIDTFTPRPLVDFADPANPGTHAAALVQDGFFVYYPTAGSISASGAYGVFRVDVFSPDPTPERIVEIPVEGGGVEVTATHVIWAEPGNNRIMRIALP